MPTIAPHVLIVDDDQTFARTLSRLLGDNGYDTATLSTGLGLPEYMATRSVDLLILDLALTGQEGFSLLETVRRDPAHRDLPILVLSSAAPEDTSVRALGLGASDVVGKPVRVQELLARIRVHLRIGRALNQARAEARSQAALVELHKQIATNLPPRELFQVLVRQVAAALRIPRCSILLGRAGTERASVVAASENPILRELWVDLTRYPEIQRSLNTGQVVHVQDVGADPVYRSMKQLVTTSILVLPFSIRGELAGVFFLRTGPEDPPLADADLRFAQQVVEAAASAIEQAQDREESRRREEAERQLAETDSLTGLLNHQALADKLEQEVERASQSGTVLTCIKVGIDGFKATTQTHGPQAGDRILVQFAELLRREQRSVDVVAHTGGEEFVVLLPETGSAGAKLFAERVLRRVHNAAFGEPETPIPISVSLGLATFPSERARDGESLLGQADQNLRHAKSEGGNRYRD